MPSRPETREQGEGVAVHLEVGETANSSVQRIRFPLEGASEIEHMNVVGGDLWSVKASGSGPAVLGLGDLARAKQCSVDELFAGATSVNATRERLNIDSTSEATTLLLRELFGAASYLEVALEASSDGGAPELLFELHTPSRPSLAERNRFLERYIADVPRGTIEPLPTLVWNPVRADQSN